MPPPCAANSSGAPGVAHTGVHSTPVMSPRVKVRSVTPFDDVVEVKYMMVPFGMVESDAPGDTAVYRLTVNTSGSAHMITAFMGLTSSCSGTVVRTLATPHRSRRAVFSRRWHGPRGHVDDATDSAIVTT